MVLLARFCGLQHDLAPARIWAAQAAAEAGTSDDRARGLLGVFSAMMAAWDGDLDAAVRESESALTLLRSAHDRAGELLAGSILGVCLGLADRGDAAVSAYESAIALAAETGERFRQSFCLAGLGEQALLRGEPEQAEELFLEALRAKAELGDRFGVAVALDSVGRASVAAGRARRGAILLGGAASTWDAIGMRETGNPFAGRSTASDGIRQARTLLGKRTFRAEFRRGSALSEEQVVAYALGDDVDLERKAAAGGALPADPARDRGCRTGGRGVVQPGDRPAAGDLRADCPGPRGEHPAQARVHLSRHDRGVGDASQRAAGTAAARPAIGGTGCEGL